MMNVYVVKGSEDGNIGVYSSMKRAIEAAKEYVVNAADVVIEDSEVEIDKRGNDIAYVTAEKSWVSADVERFSLNNE